MSEEKINHELTDDELKDVSGGGMGPISRDDMLHANLKSKSRKSDNLASPFVLGGSVISAEKEVKGARSNDASDTPALGLPIDPNI